MVSGILIFTYTVPCTDMVHHIRYAMPCQVLYTIYRYMFMWSFGPLTVVGLKQVSGSTLHRRAGSRVSSPKKVDGMTFQAGFRSVHS